MNEDFIASRELPAKAAARMREIIISNNMQPGDRFASESELVAMFGVGRSTIREAIKILIAENVVETQRGKGTFISRRTGVVKDPLGLDFTDQKKLLLNLLETRMLIEPQIAYLAAQRATGQNIRKLEEIMLTFEKDGSKEHHANLDIKFHTAVAKCTQNDVLHRFLPIICESIREGYYETVTIEGSQKRAYESHKNILAAIIRKDPETAKRETENHIVQTAKDANINLGGIH